MNRLFNTPARVLRPTTGGMTGGLMTRALLGVKTSPLDDDYMSTKLNDLQQGPIGKVWRLGWSDTGFHGPSSAGNDLFW